MSWLIAISKIIVSDMNNIIDSNIANSIIPLSTLSETSSERLWKLNGFDEVRPHDRVTWF